MTTLLHLLLWTLLTTAAVTAGAVLALRWAWRRARRALTTRLALVSSRTRRRPSALPAGLRTSAALLGPGRDVALVRRDLRAEVTGAQRAVATGRQARRPVDGLDSIVRELRAQAHALDVDLAVIATEPDRRVRRQLLAAQQERIALVRRACGQVRHGVVLAGATTTAPLLRATVAELNDEVLGLGLRARAYAELTGR